MALIASAISIVKFRVVERMDSSLPAGRLLACLPAAGTRQDAGPAYVCRLIAEVRTRPPGEVSFCETIVLNTLTEGLGPARVDSRRYVSLHENSLSDAVVPGGFLISLIAMTRLTRQCTGAMPLSLLQRHVRTRVRPIIKRERTQKDVVLELLKHLDHPAGHAANRKDRYKQVALYAE